MRPRFLTPYEPPEIAPLSTYVECRESVDPRYGAPEVDGDLKTHTTRNGHVDDVVTGYLAHWPLADRGRQRSGHHRLTWMMLFLSSSGPSSFSSPSPTLGSLAVITFRDYKLSMPRPNSSVAEWRDSIGTQEETHHVMRLFTSSPGHLLTSETLNIHSKLA